MVGRGAAVALVKRLQAQFPPLFAHESKCTWDTGASGGRLVPVFGSWVTLSECIGERDYDCRAPWAFEERSVI